MSSLYALEPQPTAKVLLQTTAGDILLELFAKQTPLTSRNFLQLCLDGYYDGTIFHRLVPGFVIQGGDPTGTGEGGEAIYDGGLFADEFHSRLKFNRRGLLGMANGGGKDDNGSQFFLTLDKTEELQGRNTMFGRVVGDTIYNLMKMAEAEVVEGSERPVYPTRMTGAEVLVNPFEDMVRRERKEKQTEEPREKKKKSKGKKGGKVLLSFGEDGEDEPVPVKKAKYNTKLVNDDGQNGQPASKPKAAKRRVSKSPSPPPPPQQTLPTRPSKRPSPSASPSASSPSPPPPSRLETTNAQISALKASMRRHDPRPAAVTEKKKSALEQLIPATSIRGRKRKHGADRAEADQEALAMLQAFKDRLSKAAEEVEVAPTERLRAEVEEGSDEEAALCDLHFIAHCESCRAWDVPGEEGVDEKEDDSSWLGHRLCFAKDRKGKDQNYRMKKGDDELVVIDPRVQEREILGKKGRGKGDREREREMKAGARGRDWDLATTNEVQGKKGW
ncbi:MAG: Peptidyl-prolyl isomerase cwc27 [Thelocarpon impressellum]|nr:MAG: Peptidyl-prolyl isomerase cwc27 [Thelocarpon impressellum]